MEKYFSLLLRSQLFNDINSEELPHMLKCLSAVKKDYQRGEYIFQAGKCISYIAIVLTGKVHIQKEDYWGNQTILSEITTGGIFGETYALTPDAPLAVNAFSITDCSILFLKAIKIISPCPNACSFHSILI